jgi:Subtilase family/Bacterial Ig-like domain/FG-GAP-like repeat
MRSGPARRALLPALITCVALLITVIAVPAAGAKPTQSPVAAAKRLPGPKFTPKSELRPKAAEDSLLVRFKSGLAPTRKRDLLAKRGLRELKAVGKTGFVKVDTAGRPAWKVHNELARLPEVASVERNWLRHASAIIPNDPSYRAGHQFGLNLMRMPDAWGVLRDAESVPIAVLDTGVDLDTPDLAGRLLPGTDVVDPGTAPDDPDGHGTMVAGIAAAGTDNSIGIAGAAWAGKVIPVRVLDENGVGEDAQIAEGVTWAADNGAKVINMSLGALIDGEVLRLAVDYAQSKGVLVVAASGNEGVDIRSFPAAYPGVVAVGATDNSGNAAWFSNYGPWVSVVAPGMNILSTLPAPGAEQAYGWASGTSFAAPAVAGVAALLRAKNPTWTLQQLQWQFRARARDAGTPGQDHFVGGGVADGFGVLGGAAAPPVPFGTDRDGVLNSAPAFSGVRSTSISVEGDLDWAKVNLPAGESTITVTPPPFQPEVNRAAEMWPVVEVYDSARRLQGRAWGEFTGDGQPLVATLPVFVPTAGTWYISVRNAFVSRSPGLYEVRVTSGGEPFGAPFFDTLNFYEGGGTARSVGLHDVSGDGALDAVTLTAQGQVGVLHRNPDGTYAGAYRLPVDGTVTDAGGPASVAVGDLNGDGRADAAVAADAGISIYRQVNGRLTGPVALVATPGPAHNVAIADMNKDGRNDLVVGFKQPNGPDEFLEGIAVWHGTTSGGFTPHVEPYIFAMVVKSADAPVPLTVADVNRDGRLDVVVAFPVSPVAGQPPCQARILTVVNLLTEGFPNGNYAVNDPILPSTCAPAGLAVGDMNGDSRPDIVVSGDTSNTVTILHQDNSGRYPATGMKTVAVAPKPGSVRIADLDQDGRRDVAVLHDHVPPTVPPDPPNPGEPGGVGMVLSTGGLSDEFLIDFGLLPGKHGPTALSPAGDVNGDGSLDFVIADNEVVTLEQAPVGWPAWVVGSTVNEYQAGVSRTSPITLTLARTLNPATISGVELRTGTTGNPFARTVTWNATARTLTIQPNGGLGRGIPYTIVVTTSVKDTSGRNLTKEFQLHFTTSTA